MATYYNCSKWQVHYVLSNLEGVFVGGRLEAYTVVNFYNVNYILNVFNQYI